MFLGCCVAVGGALKQGVSSRANMAPQQFCLILSASQAQFSTLIEKSQSLMSLARLGHMSIPVQITEAQI